MAWVNHFLIGILILQINVHAAPSDTSKMKEIAKVEEDTLTQEKLEDSPKLDADPQEKVNDTSASNSTETQRQKRWYNPYGYGFPPINPVIYPSYNNYNKRDEGPNTAYYGTEDPLVQIHRRIQEIANIVRQPPPPPPPHIPIFYPVLFIPTGGCACNGNNPAPDATPKPDTNQTDPNINNRWPDMDDERQNWGFVINETDVDDGEDFTRPISFDPIRLNRPVRPPPPVEHGTVQSDSTMQEQPQSTTTTTSQSPPTPARAPTSNRPQNAFPSGPRPSAIPPSPCDGAILTCCHQPQVSYDCFAIQGCPDFTSYPNGNPCDPNLILRVIQRFQAFYGTRNG